MAVITIYVKVNCLCHIRKLHFCSTVLPGIDSQSYNVKFKIHFIVFLENNYFIRKSQFKNINKKHQ